MRIMQRRHTPSPLPRSRWKPTHHGRYFLILGDGSIHTFLWSNTEFDHRAWQFGNCFRRRTVAEHARQAIYEVLRHVQQHPG